MTPIQPDVRTIARQHPLLMTLDDNARDALIDAGRVVPHRARSTILKEGEAPDQVYFLTHGAVRVFHRRGDQEIVVKLFAAPAMFGEMEVLAGLPFLEHVTALERSYTLQISATLFRRAVERQPKFAAAVARDVSTRLCIATVNERALVFDKIEARLAALLWDYAELRGEPSGKGRRISLPLSQEQMARDLGASRRAVVIGLDKLRDAGIVVKKAGRYEIVDSKALVTQANRVLGLLYQSR
jgi:CRP/FNR family transcriptional regulator, cyclic AMP receptor protein